MSTGGTGSRFFDVLLGDTTAPPQPTPTAKDWHAYRGRHIRAITVHKVWQTKAARALAANDISGAVRCLEMAVSDYSKIMSEPRPGTEEWMEGRK